MSVLQEICARKAEHVAARKQVTPLEVLKTRLAEASPPRGFLKALQARKPSAIIAEVKKASPSKGVIREDFDPAALAVSYERGGAACVSVLTDPPYFHGSDQNLVDVRNTISLPVLRKDFMIDEYQIYESRALGADCILLIMACLSDTQAADFYDLARDLGMDVLVEVHDEAEMTRALAFKPHMIGVNNRNLKTMEVSLETSRRVGPLIPEWAFRISESGLSGAGEIQTLQASGFEGFLIGEAFMRQADNGAALRAILTQNKN